MEFMKKQSAGFFITVLALILAGISVIFYLINCNTNYFKSAGVDSKIIVLAVIAIVAQVVLIIASEVVGSKKILDILPVVATVLLVLALVTFVTARVNGIASIMTFENNANNMADLSSALVGIGCFLFAIILNVISSFFSVVKD